MTTLRNLQHRTAIITGASRGVGPYIARALAKEGMNLVLAARSETELKKAADEVRANGVRAVAVPTDVADEDARDALIRTAEQEFGAIDVLINNAGIEVTSEFHKHDGKEIERLMDVNLLAPIELTRLVLPGMIERGRGHIVNVSSAIAKIPAPYAVTYSATKAGLNQFTASIREEYRGSGVSASAVLPGAIRDVGMAVRAQVETGVQFPASMMISPESVAQDVVRAIKRDLAEVVVAPAPARVLLHFPSLMAPVGRRSGLVDSLKTMADVRERERSERRGASGSRAA